MTKDADPGLFGPDSVTWRVHADPSLPLGGLRALLLQAVHPLAMAGVAEHSGFRADPWGRLGRTAQFVATTTFGTTREAERAGARVRGMHGSLAGVEPESGQPYRVADPHLLTWVHCCEAESFLSTAVRAGLRLSPADRDRYYAEQTAQAALVGVDAATVPSSVAEVADYFASMQAEVRVTARAREAARFIVFPPMPVRVAVGTPARPAWAGVAGTAFALLPRWARTAYRLSGPPGSDLAASALARAFRTALLAVPQGRRHGPDWHAAQTRLGLA